MKEYDEQFDVCPHCGYIYNTPAEEAYHMNPGSILQGRYIVGKVIGFGGFGVTYIGWDAELERRIAIKEYLPSEFATRMADQTQLTIFSGDKEEQFESGLVKFVDEAKRLAQFHHTNGIVHIFDSFSENRTAYIVMEYLEGESLKEKIQRDGKMEPQEAIEIMLPVLYALREVHKEGIIHRDIAPDNIFLTNDFDEDGRRIVKLIDFGASRFATTRHSRSLSVLVKPGYSPEEQYRSRGDQGPWTDVYAVAATMYKMMTGITPEDAMERAVKDDLKTPSKCGVKISKGMENAVLNAMNIKIENRTPSVEVLIEELESEDTARRKEKIKHMDVGKWPLWLKIVSASSVAAVAALAILVGTLGFNNTGKFKVPDGYALVPNVLNLKEEKAEKKVEEAKMVYQILDKQYSAEIPSNRVLAQTELGGSLLYLKTQNTLGVVVSAGTEKTYVPDVVNFMVENAESELMAINLDYKTSEQEGDDAPGSVSSQSIEAGTEVDGGTVVELVVSTGRNFDSSLSAEIPDIVGMQYSDAKALLLEKGLYLAKEKYEASDTVPAGEIIRQSIEVGTSVQQNSILYVTVSIGNGTTHVPDVQYKTEEEAKALLEANHLKVKTELEDSDIVAKGNVIRQDKEPGTEVKYDTVVTIYISKGNKNADNTLTAKDAVITQEVQDAADEAAKTAMVEETKDKPDNNDNSNSSDSKSKTDNSNSSDSKSKTDNSSTNDNSSNSNEDKKPKTTKVASVTGKSESDAKSSITSSGLIPVVTYAFSSNVAEGNVISQSVSAGTEVQLSSVVTLLVSKGPEAPSGWTTDASFVNSKWYTVQTKTQYRKQTRSIETMSSTNPDISGWTRDDSKTTETWGGFTDWSMNYVAGSSTREVQTKGVDRVDYQYTEYYLERYYSDVHGAWEVIKQDSTYNDAGCGWYNVNLLTLTEGPPRWRANTYWVSGLYACGVGGYPCLKTNERTLNHVVTDTYYRYRDKIFTYYFSRYTNWSSWSNWGDEKSSSDDVTNVEERTVYYYTAK